jgi:hypothetical protein
MNRFLGAHEVNISVIIAFSEAVFCYFLVSLGFVLQKKGIRWLDLKGTKNPTFVTNRRIWFIGLILLNLAIIPNYLALGVLSSYIVNAISGLNIVFTIFLSKLILNETLFFLDYIYTFIMCAAIAIINLIDQTSGAVQTIHSRYAYWAAIIPIGLLLIWFILHRTKLIRPASNYQAILLAALGGSMSGLMVTYLKILEIQQGMALLSYIASPYFYCFLAVALLSMVAFQITYKMAAMIVVGPSQYAMMIFYPTLAAYLIFQIPVHPIQIVSFAVIIITVGLMMYLHSSHT